MKTSSIFLAPVLGLAILLSPARAEEPAANNVQEVQNILSELAKRAAAIKDKQEGAPDLTAVLAELSKMVTTATPGATKEEQAQEAQLIGFIKALLAMVPTVPQQVVDPADEPAANPATITATTANPTVTVTAAGNASVTPKAIQGSTGLQGSSGLSTGSLSTTPRMTDAEWRTRFPARQTGR